MQRLGYLWSLFEGISYDFFRLFGVVEQLDAGGELSNVLFRFQH